VITIAATETADTLRLTVQDDGKGLDREALTRKGVEMGLVAEGARLTDEDLVKLLFSAGVSTAEQVSDISGRGVGMDVVRQNIESGGGSITVRSEPGQGSTFTIEVKKSVNTQIIDGFGIIDQGNPFIFPMERVVRCFRPGESTVQSAMGKGTFVRDGDELIAIHNFTLLCGGELDQVADPAQSILLVLEGSGRKIALQIDDIDSVKQVVLKDVEGLNADHDLFIGGAVMGNGQVAMIVDVDQLVGEALSCETSICQAADQLEPETVPC
jgi:two-component system chemotaxis sensor kinase CheA